MIATCFALILIGQQQPQKPPEATAIIRGHIIAGDTGQPLRKVQVRLTPMGPPPVPSARAGRESRTAATDGDGNYEFGGLPAGPYFLYASKPGYIGLEWGQPPPTQGGKPLEVGAGQTIEHIDFTLQHGGVIAGRIFDEFGEPLSGLQVSAMRSQLMSGGERQLMQTGSGQTNDLGEFRIFGLAPGQYYVQATWRLLGPGDPTSPDRTGYPTTFFPGTTDAATAQRFTIGATQTIGDLAMALSPIKTVRLEGTAVDSKGRPLANASLTIVQETSVSGYMSSGQGIRPDGTFVLTNVTPGEYVLRIQSNDDRKQVASMKLTVGADDITDLRVVAWPPSTISGRIVVDPAQAASLPATTFSVIGSAVDPSPVGRFGVDPARVADDLAFEVTAPVGKATINVTNLPLGWWIRSVRVNSIDVTDDGIDVKPNEHINGVEVELTNKVTTVSGIVTDGRGGAAKDCWTVIFPADSKRWTRSSRYIRAWRAGPDGRFKAAGMRPGDYYIIALDKMEPGQNNDPEFLERIRPRATSFSLGEGETKTIDLRLNTPQ